MIDRPGQVLGEVASSPSARGSRRRTGSRRARRGRRRHRASSSASTSGRANASPTITRKLACSRATSCQRCSGSKRRSVEMMTVPPLKSVVNAIQCAVPCMNGHAGRQRVRPVRAPCRRSPRASLIAAAGEVAAAERAEEDVLVAPHHALRHAGRAAGVEDVEVVGRRGAGSRGPRVTRRARPRSAIAPSEHDVRVRAVLDRDERRRARAARRGSRAASARTRGGRCTALASASSKR